MTGVGVFFVLSGFLITSRLMTERGGVNLRRFYMRRMFRIMPCAWAYLIVAFILVRSHMHAGEVTSCVLFFRNYVSFGMFSFTVHFWSLSIEEQFYLIWPGVFVIAGTRRAGWIALTGAVILAALRYQHWSYYASLPLPGSTHTELCADGLLVGCAAAILSPKCKGVRLPTYPLVLAFAWCVYHYSSFVPLVESTIIALLLLSTTLHSTTKLAKALEMPALRYIGKLSYSIYIWQQIPAAFYAHNLAVLPYKIVVLSVVVLVSYYGLEKPMISFGKTVCRIACSTQGERGTMGTCEPPRGYSRKCIGRVTPGVPSN